MEHDTPQGSTASPEAQAAAPHDGARPPAALPPRRSATRWQLALKLLVSGAVLALLAIIVDWREFARIALSAKPEFLLLAAALLVLGNVAIAWRWQLLMAPVGIVVTLAQALKSYLKGHFVGHFIPSGMAADVVKAVDMHRFQVRTDRGRGIELASSIFMERGFGAITVGIAVAAGLTVSPLLSRHADTQQAMMLSAIVVVACSVAALYTDRFLALVPRALLRRTPKVDALVLRARETFVAYRQEPARLVAVMLLSLVIQALRILPVYAVALSIGAGGEFFAYLIAVPVIFLANTIPFVGSRVGTEQGLFVLLLGLAGVGAEAAMVIALMSLALGMLVALPGGYWLVRDTTPATQPYV